MVQKEVAALMDERFGHDELITVATLDGDRPRARIVNAFYEDGVFYTVTYALSNKMQQILKKPNVAVSGQMFSANGIGENIGHPDDNADLMVKLRKAFASWYDNGHVDESDPNTCVLAIRLSDGILFDEEDRHVIEF